MKAYATTMLGGEGETIEGFIRIDELVPWN